MDSLTRLVKQKRKVETRVTNDNKQMIINQINTHSKEYEGFWKIPNNASVAEVTRINNQYKERLTYDIVTLAISRGNDIVAEVEGRDIKHSEDIQTKRLGEFGKQLARAKKESDSHLSKEEKAFIERGNNKIKGYGNATEGIVNLIENAKTPKQIKNIIDEIKTQDPKKIFYDKQIEVFERTFQKVGIVREDDLNKLKDKIRSLKMGEALSATNEMLRVIQTFDYKLFAKTNVDETEIANARLDDMLIKMGLTDKGSKKVKKVFDKYKAKYNEKSGYIPE